MAKTIEVEVPDHVGEVWGYWAAVGLMATLAHRDQGPEMASKLLAMQEKNLPVGPEDSDGSGDMEVPGAPETPKD